MLNHIENAKDYIKKTRRLHNPNKEEFLKDEKTYFAVSMTLFTLLNEIIKTGESIIEKENLKIPLSYRDISVILRKEKVITEKLGKTLEGFCKYRNMLAHQYSSFEFEKVYELAQKMEVFEDFIREVLEFYNKNVD